MGYRIMPPAGAVQCESAVDAKAAAPDPVFLERLERRIAYQYPFRAVCRLPARFPPRISKSGPVSGRFRPAFLSRHGMTPWSGDPHSRFMQFCDYRAAERDIDAEPTRLREKGYLTPEQAAVVDQDRVGAFSEARLAAE